MAEVVNTAVELMVRMAKVKGESDSSWRDRLFFMLKDMMEASTDSSKDSLLGKLFSFHFGSDVVWYQVVSESPLSIHRIPSATNYWNVDPWTLASLGPKEIRKLVFQSSKSFALIDTPSLHGQ